MWKFFSSKKSGNVTYLEIANDIKNDTKTISKNIDKIRIEKEIERLDREWLLKRERYSNRSKNNSGKAQNNIVSIILLALFAIFFIGICVTTFTGFNNFPGPNGPPTFVKYSTLALVLIFILKIGLALKNNNELSKLKNKYLSQRGKLLKKLEDQK